MTRVIASRQSETPHRCRGARRRLLGLALAIACTMAGAPTACADVFDLTLNRLVLAPLKDPKDPGYESEKFAGPTTPRNITAAVPSAYRSFVSELGVALAPGILTPSDTIGYNGFQFDVDYNFTTINNRKCAPGDARDKCPWMYSVAGGLDDAGNAKSPPGFVHTLTVMARKGIWLPLPSFEIGAGATKMLQSDIFAVQVYAKFALHEGFHDWPLPSIAVRGSAVRVMGSNQLDLTMAQVDASISKSFGLGGTVTLVPYLGAAVLFIIARGQVLDLTPEVDAYRQGPMSVDLNNNAVFPSQDNIMRWRFFGGFRLNYSILVLSADLIISACGDLGTNASNRCYDASKAADQPHDGAQTQYTFSLGAGFLF